ncbi:hypothetical protein Rhe02_66770 [Rhizocola hellebori]|uniref:Uncharacterized protein n=1 Tax=Rhizocola hellebori TaxID=1392758 RepID=A0A8J3QD99_9ACTN|nr:transcriptional regulator [Rhizocola hellebori]GIH08610.1 hypothetical protein Rhe02_66770 [Rhizocola hellebori]
MSAPDAVITAAAVLENKVDLRAYPYRYLSVYTYNKFRGDGVRQVLAAAEVLSHQGFDLVNISEFSGNQIYAIMCRR